MSDNDLSRHRFLVIDDFPGMRTMLRDMVRECGGKIIDMAANGKEAIQQLAHTKYDVVLCDFNLGAGKNGQQLLEEARVKQWAGPACAWIMVTAEKTPDSVLGAVEFMPDGYLIKPVTSGLLFNRLTKIIARKSAFQQIDKAVRQNDLLGAIALCDGQMAQDKANAGELLRWKSQMLLTIGELDQARALFEQVLRERDLAWAKVGLAKVCYHQGDFAGVVDLLRQVIHENRTYIEAYDWLAKALQELGELNEARQILQRAAQLSPNSPVRQKNLGELALQEGDMDGAEEAFRKSMAVGEHSVLKTPDSCIGLARVFGARKQPEEAARLLSSLPKQFEGSEVLIRAKATEGLIFQENNQAARAAQAAQELTGLLKQSLEQPGSAASLDAAALLLATGHREAGVELLQSVVKNNHDNVALIAKVQHAFDTAGMGDEGTHLVETSKREAVQLMNEGVLLARDGKLQEAVASMRRAKAAMPANVRVLFNCAYVMIVYLQKVNKDPIIMRDARQALLQANMLAPGEKRFAQLMSQLENL